MNTKKIVAVIKAFPLACGLLLAAALMAGWAYWRQSDALDQAQSDHDDAIKQSELYSDNITAGNNLAEDLTQMEDYASKLDTVLINPSDVLTNQQYFYDFQPTTGAHIVDPLQANVERNAKDPTEPSVCTFTLSAVGHWDSITNFIYGLQTGPHLVRFNIFRLEKSRSSNGIDSNQLTLTLNVDVLGK